MYTPLLKINSNLTTAPSKSFTIMKPSAIQQPNDGLGILTSEDKIFSLKLKEIQLIMRD